MEGQHKKSFSYLGGEMAERLAYGGTKDVRKGGSSMGNKDSSINNIYQLDGKVPVAKAIPLDCSISWPCSFPIWRRLR